MGVKDLARFGRRHAALGADQQLLVQLAFRGRNLLAQRRLCDVQDFSGWVRLPISTIFTKYFSRLKFILPPVRNTSTNTGRLDAEGFAICLPAFLQGRKCRCRPRNKGY